jgi:transposase
MNVIYERCAGLDVHKDVVVGSIRVAQGSQVVREVRRFATTTTELEALREWLRSMGCTHVAMESTGVYWKPVWHVLEEGSFELVLANAAHIRNVPGRKSDVNDATWIADLLAHGLIRASFVPPEKIQELRDLTRTRKQLRREIVQHTQRIQRVLEDANVKLASVVSDVLGMSGRRILRALIAGKIDARALAELGSERLARSKEELTEALRGRVTAHHRFLLRQHLDLVEQLEGTIARFDAEIEARLDSFRDAVEHLKTIPGVSEITAQVIVAEIGLTMSRFPTPAHLLSWAGLCPALNQSAGKRLSTRIGDGDPWLKTTLVQSAWAAVRKKNSYLESQYLRLKARRGAKKAIIAVAASMLTAAYHMLRDGTDYKDLGSRHFLRQDRRRLAQSYARRLRDLGYHINLEEAA